MACHGLFTLHVRISDNTGFNYRKNIGRFNREFSEQFSSLLHQLVTLPFGPFEHLFQARRGDVLKRVSKGKLKNHHEVWIER